MKKLFTLVLFMSFFIFIVLQFSSCKKNDAEPAVLSEKSKQEITTSYSDISSAVNQLLQTDNPLEEIQNMIPTFQKYSGVERVWISENTLFVKFTDGGTISWTIKSSLIIPPYEKSISIPVNISYATAENTPTNNKAVLINQQYGDEERHYCKDLINRLTIELKKIKYSVDIKNGSDADINFLGTNLSNYGVIFYISHGSYDGTNVWISSGEEGTIEKLTGSYYELWKANKLSLGTNSEERNGEKVSISYFIFSQNFINEKYKSNSFPNSIIYLVACQGLKSNDLAIELNKKGAGVIIGWDETNCLGQPTGGQLFDALIGGKDVNTAISNLPENSKIDKCSVESGAKLVYYPTTGGSMRLANSKNTKVVIKSPLAGSNSVQRVIQLTGYCSGFKKIIKGTVEVNSITTRLNFTDTLFIQPIVINSGDNKIKVNCYGDLSDGTTSFSSQEIEIIGNFPILDLFTELRWNQNLSDIDLHLLPPNSDISDLWTNYDCYYSNKTTTWNGALDVDNILGYGPEHITIPKTTISGIYTLYVHFYEDMGSGSTDAFIDISVKNGTFASFGPLQFKNPGVYGDGGDYGGKNRGDLWEVCKIEFPSGTITKVDKYYFLGSATYKSATIAKKNKQ